MKADLVRAARFRETPKSRETVEMLRDFVKRPCGTGVGVIEPNHFLLTLTAGMVTDRRVDPVAVAHRPTVRNRKILLLNEALLELRGKFRMGKIVTGDQDHAASEGDLVQLADCYMAQAAKYGFATFWWACLMDRKEMKWILPNVRDAIISGSKN